MDHSVFVELIVIPSRKYHKPGIYLNSWSAVSRLEFLLCSRDSEKAHMLADDGTAQRTKRPEAASDD